MNESPEINLRIYKCEKRSPQFNQNTIKLQQMTEIWTKKSLKEKNTPFYAFEMSLSSIKMFPISKENRIVKIF